MIVGCYVLHLYCDAEGGCDESPSPSEYTGHSGPAAEREARDDGWLLGRDGTALCPAHSGKTPKPRDHEETISIADLGRRPEGKLEL